jgi:hypothetical protein
MMLLVADFCPLQFGASLVACTPMLPRPSARRIAEQILAEETGGSIATEEAISAVIRVHGKLGDTMSLVLGQEGFKAMFARTVQKTKCTFPSLEGVSSGSRDGVLDRLKTVLSQQEASTVLEVGVALLETSFDLLSMLIGEELTLRLFRSTWPEPVASALAPTERS